MEIHIFPTVSAAHHSGFGGPRMLYNNDLDKRGWVPAATGPDWIKGQRPDKVFVHFSGATALSGKSLNNFHKGIEEARFCLRNGSEPVIV